MSTYHTDAGVRPAAVPEGLSDLVRIALRGVGSPALLQWIEKARAHLGPQRDCPATIASLLHDALGAPPLGVRRPHDETVAGM